MVQLGEPSIRYVPVGGCEALVGLESAGQTAIATIALVDGQNSETYIERVDFDGGVGRRTRLIATSPFYFPAPPQGAAPFAYVDQGQLMVTDRVEPIAVPVEEWGAFACVVTPDGERAFINTQQQLLCVELSRGQTRVVAEAHEQWFGLCASPDGRAVAAATNSAGCEVSVFDTTTLKRIEQYALDSFVYQPVFSADGSRIVVGDTEGVLLIERADGSFRRIRQTEAEVLSCTFDPSGRYVASAERDLVVTDLKADQAVLSWSLDVLRQRADLTPVQHELARTVARDPEFAVTDDTEAGAGVSGVRWTSEGLTAVALGGHAWQFSAASIG